MLAELHRQSIQPAAVPAAPAAAPAAPAEVSVLAPPVDIPTQESVASVSSNLPPVTLQAPTDASFKLVALEPSKRAAVDEVLMILGDEGSVDV